MHRGGEIKQGEAEKVPNGVEKFIKDNAPDLR
jgi:hypothetical protein